LKFSIPVIVFDCEELGKLVWIEFPRLLLNVNQDLDVRVDREHVAKYLYNNGDRRTTQFEHTNITMETKKLAANEKIDQWSLPKHESRMQLDHWRNTLTNQWRLSKKDITLWHLSFIDIPILSCSRFGSFNAEKLRWSKHVFINSFIYIIKKWVVVNVKGL
jgi:hypothetical protein